MSGACRYESQVLHAATSESWSEALRQHVSVCEECSVTAAVAPWMDDFAHSDARQTPLPDPSVVWLKARLLGGAAAVDRAAQPLHVFQYVAYFVVAAGWAGLLTWKWNLLQMWLFSITPSRVVQNAAVGASLSMTFFLAILVLSSMTIMLAMHTILADE